MKEMVRPAVTPPGWRGPSLAPDQRLVTGRPEWVLVQVARGKRAGAFTCDEINVYDVYHFAYAVVTMTPQRGRINWPVLALLVLAAWTLIAGLFWLISSIPAWVVVGLALAGIVAFLRVGPPSPGPSVNVDVNVKVQR